MYYIVFWEFTVFVTSNFIGLYRPRWQPPLSLKSNWACIKLEQD